MATQFTPITTVSPTAVNDSGKIDEAISLVQGLLKQRQDSADQKYTNTVRSRTLNAFQEEDRQKEMTINQNNNFLGLMQSSEKNFDTKLLQDKTLNGELSPEQAKALMPYANDYVSEDDRVLAFAEGLKQIDTKDPVQLATLMTNTGVDETTARYYISNMNKGKAARGGSGGTGSGTGKTDSEAGAKLLEGQAGAINTKKMLRSVGMNYGSHRVKIYGSDLTPNAQVLVNGKNYKKDLNGYYEGKNGKWKRIDNLSEAKAEIKKSLDAGFSAFQEAHIKAQGKTSGAIRTTFEDDFTNE